MVGIRVGYGSVGWRCRHGHAPEPNLTVVRFHEVNTLFANPGQGWMGRRGLPCSVVYTRFNWEAAEPAPGQFNWNVIDDVIAKAKPRGARVAFRVMTCNAHSGGYYCSPKWLFDAGCKGFEYLVGGDNPTAGGKRLPRIEPDYADPIYLARHGAFLEALGKRYNGHPDIELLDIGSYGVWGEWHTKHPAPLAVRQKIVDMYLNAFPRTPLVFMSDDAEVLKYALAHGTGLRRDGVGSPWHEQSWIGSKKYAAVPDMGEAWKHAGGFRVVRGLRLSSIPQMVLRRRRQFHAEQPCESDQQQHRPRSARSRAATGKARPAGRLPLRVAGTVARSDGQSRAPC